MRAKSTSGRIAGGAVAAFALAFALSACGHSAKPEALRVQSLRVEYKENPLGIDARQPRLSWLIVSTQRDTAQSAYQVRVAADEEALRNGGALAWDSGKVDSAQSIQLSYAGPALESRRRYYWQVRVWDAGGRESAWSEVAHWEMGLLSPADWGARWIGDEPGGRADDAASPMLRREFRLGGDVARARAYVTSRGLYEMHLNGRRVGDQLLTPGWTSYGRRLQYQIYDVTQQLNAGANAVGVQLGKGWYRGIIGYDRHVDHYGDRVALLLQIEVTYRDGRSERIVSGERWKASTGPILMSEIYDGETYDARLEKAGWSEPGFDDSAWRAARVLQGPAETLIAPEGPPVRAIEEVAPKSILRTPAGETVVDMGQNMVGWVRLRVQGPAGTVVTLRHAEVLDQKGNFYTGNLRKALQTVRYTLSGRGAETFEPHFTFQGFRYVAVDGYPGELTPQSLTGIVIHSDMSRTGQFATSKPLVDQLQHNIVWGQKGNFVDVPTDCPQRDERLGWTGDAQVFSPTAAFNMDVAAFFTKWLKDLAADQYADGSVPWVVPDVATKPEKPAAGAAGWGDAATVIPWNLYLAYGDRRLLEAQYESMERWVQFQRARAGEDLIWDGDEHFGDWLDFFGAAKKTSRGSTSTDLIATAYFARSTDILRRAAAVLGKEAAAARHAQLLAGVTRAFREKFVAADGRVGEGTQTAYVLALDFDLLPEDLRPKAAELLARDVRDRGHLTTGFLGTPHLLTVLTRFGHLDLAYMLLNREEFPSWLYPVKQGATTIWERWDGRRPDGSFQDEGMNSFNHYAYGAVGEWMYRVMAGIDIDPQAPGYKHVLIAPRPGGGFTRVSASHSGPYGTVSSAWTLQAGRFELRVAVPANSTATVRLPQAELSAVEEGGKPAAEILGPQRLRQDGGDVIAEIGSGEYAFSYPMRAE
jgi:alpha-L-rhamnosidase